MLYHCYLEATHAHDVLYFALPVSWEHHEIEQSQITMG